MTNEFDSSELTQAQQTLIIGDWTSVCGNCGQNASYDEESHINEKVYGVGCGVVWLYVTTDSPGNDYSHLRPDLIPREMMPALDGVADEVEEQVLRENKISKVYIAFEDKY